MTDLCTRCGFCCDGTLFDCVSVLPEEPPRRLPVVNGRVLQPCAAFREGRCSIYDDRPVRCAAYRCATLQALEAGRIDIDAALERVQRVRTLLDAVAASLPAPELDIWRRAEIALDDPSLPADRRADLVAKLEEAAMLLRRDFEDDRALY